MKNFLIFIALIFATLFGAFYFKKQNDKQQVEKPVLKIFASSSFIAPWGPGPILKAEFEKSCACTVEFFDNADSVITIQRLRSGVISDSVDVVLGLDQYDLEMAKNGIEWKQLAVDNLDFIPQVRELVTSSELLPYNWSYLTFIVNRSFLDSAEMKLEDLLQDSWSRGIALQDPRTSSPGLQFIMWLVQVRGEEEAFKFLKNLSASVHSYSPSWSSSYALFQKGQAKAVFSYATSQIYHEIEESSKDYVALSFAEGNPIQYEYVGVPAICNQCELGEKFVHFMMTVSGQKVLMQKNYMLPVILDVTDGTPFEHLPELKPLSSYSLPSYQERERILKKWSALRRGD